MKVDIKTFLEKLQIVGKTVASSDKVPLFRSFCIKDNFIKSYDGICGTICRYDLPGIEGCTDAGQFLALVKSIGTDFDLSQEDSGFRITSATTDVLLPTSPVGRFPDFLPKNHHQVLGPDSGLAAAFRTCLRLTDDSKIPHYSGVGINGSHVYASDGSRATRCDLNVPASSLYTIPRSTASRIAENSDPAKVFGNKNCLAFTYEKSLLVTQLNAVDVPTVAIDSQIDAFANPINVELPENFAESLSRCKLFADEKTSGASFTAGDGKLQIACKAKGRGNITETLDCGFKNAFSVFVHPSNTLDILKLTRSIDLSSLLCQNPRCIRFNGVKFSHLVCLMSPTI